jgi:hypothetical protein
MFMSILLKALAAEAGRVPERSSLVARTGSLDRRSSGPGRGARAVAARRRRAVFRAVLFVVGGLLALTVFGLSARAGGTHVLVIPTDDGYGLSDCLTENASCGPIVASAWCKAKGHGASGTLGPVGEARASDVPGLSGQGSRGFAVTCHE